MFKHFKRAYNFILGRDSFKIQTFTYYIPAPPRRKTGYREKEFDKIFYHFVNQGFEILNVQTQSHTGESGSGMWVLFTLKALNLKAQELNLDNFPESFGHTEQALHYEERGPQLEISNDL